VAVQEITPVTLVFLRVTLAGILLYLIAYWRGKQMPNTLKAWKPLIVIGFLQAALPFVLVAWAEQFVSSALTSLLIGFTPISTIVIAHLFTEDDRLTTPKILGLVVGLMGLAFLLGPVLLAPQKATLWGVLVLLAVTLCYALAVVYVRPYAKQYPPMVLSSGEMLSASVMLLPIMLVWERPFALTPSLPAIASLLGVSIIGTVIAYMIYYHFLTFAPPTYVSLTAYTVPMVSVVLGYLVLGEALSWSAWVGFGLIIAGVGVLNSPISFIPLWFRHKYLKQA